MAIHDYLESTEPAVRHLFDGIQAYDSTKLPTIVDYVDETGMVRMTKAENEAFLKAYENFFDLEYARATLAGSVLQVAYGGIKQYSSVKSGSSFYQGFEIKDGSIAEKCCLGREVHGIPIGLLIYAGRAQYNHWEEGQPSNPVVRKVFEHLVSAYYHNTHFDMAYVLDYPSPRPVSHYIVRMELKWRAFDDYQADMSTMLYV